MGVLFLFLLLFMMAVSIAAVVFGIIFLAEESFVLGGILLGVGILFSCVVGPILFEGFKGAETERGAGFNPVRSILWHLNRPGLFYVNPFVTAVNPAAQPAGALQSSSDPGTAALQAAGQVMTSGKKFR